MRQRKEQYEDQDSHRACYDLNHPHHHPRRQRDLLPLFATRVSATEMYISDVQAIHVEPSPAQLSLCPFELSNAVQMQRSEDDGWTHISIRL